MGNDKSKTKSAMLSELESIKGLLLEEDDIPILQEVIEPRVSAPSTSSHLSTPITPDDKSAAAKNQIDEKSETQVPETRVIVEQQQDFFDAEDDALAGGEDLLESLDDLEAKTAALTHKPGDNNRMGARPNLAKATGENPFLPEHIRARLHGNNPPPLFAAEAARKIAGSARPITQLGNLQPRSTLSKATSIQQDIIDSIVARMMPEMEKELRQRLETLSKNILEELNKP